MTTGSSAMPQPQDLKLDPPWYTIAKQLQYTIGLTPGVTVGNLDTSGAPFVLPIAAKDPAQARALATILKSHYGLGNVQVQVQVIPGSELAQPESATDAEHVLNLIHTALKGNPFLVDVQVKSLGPWGPPVVWPIFAKAIVQFPNDDISDYYSNYNEMAAKVFRTILLEQINGVPVACSTSNR